MTSRRPTLDQIMCRLDDRWMAMVSDQQLRQLRARTAVACLSSARALKRMQMRLKAPSTPRPPPVDGQYWAEALRDVRLNTACEMVVRVKWEGYAEGANTWQTARDLASSDVLFEAFYRTLFGDNHVTHYSNDDIAALECVLSDVTREEKTDDAIVVRLSGRSDADSFALSARTWRQMRASLEKWAVGLRRARAFSSAARRVLARHVICELEIDERFGDLRAFLDFARKRRESAKALSQWRRRVNDALTTGDALDVHNGVDAQTLPPLEYALRSRLHASLRLDERESRLPARQCACEGDCRGNRSCECALAHYRDSKRFKTSHVIYECNERCGCSARCPTRRVQNMSIGRHLCVFRTRDRGWGLMSRTRIPYPAFVMEYTGEVIASEEAASRGDSTYFFQLDAEFVGRTLFIDGRRYGNVARFANHSCDPNLTVHLCVAEAGDRVPRVAFFAARPIPAFEELTWDYKRTFLSADSDGQFVSDTTSEADSGYAGSTNQIACLCGSDVCKGFV